ncbi:hypothetical protein [Actinoplanes regularis]|uniref:BRCT domain-containing protein n=1 Tax=Actinoplanes regularis TaxID=52697 RepID=A0A239AJR7_9ACTN|nr:hypothetical protein [Actinoplanes regularis]GIE91830.1 hypothetical protein Are01nite_83100 [Actinoplanes regularis]SNR95631.1 hypothetical protein SAMN06264365_107383 [Actinoplanes regularis]
MWQDVAAVREDLRDGGAVALANALSANDVRTWLALEPAERREVLAAASPSRRDEIAAFAKRVATRDATTIFDDLVTFPDLSAGTCCTALERLYDRWAGTIDPGRARAYLAAALPHGPAYPKIFRCAARVYLELGERDRVVETVAACKRSGRSLRRIRDEMALAPMWGHPGYAELFAHMSPPLFVDLDAALLAGPEAVRRLRTDSGPWGELRRLVNLERVDLRWGDEQALEGLAELPRLVSVKFHGRCRGPKPTWALATLVELPALREFSFEASGVSVQPDQVRALRADFARRDLPEQDRTLHVALLFDTDDGTAEQFGVRGLVAALDSAVPAVRQTAQRILAYHLAVPAGGLPHGAGILLAGELNADRAVLVDRLAAAGVTVQREPGPATRLAVVGERHEGRALTYLDAGIPLILEDHLRASLDRIEQRDPIARLRARDVTDTPDA